MLKVQSLDQNLKCSQCRTPYSVKTCRRITNFTYGEITFFCRNCRAKTGFLTFEKWNALHRAFQKRFEEKKTIPPNPRPRENQRSQRR